MLYTGVFHDSDADIGPKALNFRTRILYLKSSVNVVKYAAFLLLCEHYGMALTGAGKGDMFLT